MDPLDNGQFGFLSAATGVPWWSVAVVRTAAPAASQAQSAVVVAVSVGRAAPTSPPLGLLTVRLPPVLGWQVVVLTRHCW